MQSSNTVVLELISENEEVEFPEKLKAYVVERKRDGKYLYLRWDVSPQKREVVYSSKKAVRYMVVKLENCQRSGSAYLDDELNDHLEIWKKKKPKGIFQKFEMMFKSTDEKAELIGSYHFHDLEARDKFRGVFQDRIIENPKNYFQEKHDFKFEFWTYDGIFTGEGKLPIQYRSNS
jgi:hypothetical protein